MLLKVNYLVPVVNDSPDWPPQTANTGAQWDAGPGSYCSCIGQVPNAPTIIAQICTSEANHALIQADGRWEFIEEVVDEPNP